MNRTERLYALTHALRVAGNRGRTAGWLAERFEVSPRTIKRDIAALVAIGEQIVSQDGRGGGYQLSQHAALSAVTFTAAEATAVAVALAGDPQLPFGVDGEAALQKVLRAMNPTQRVEADAVASRVWMRRRGQTRRPALAKILDEALRAKVVVVIDYEDEHGALSVRRAIEPMAFARTRLNWHLLAWCRLRNAGRWFRLDRVRRARLTREVCAPRSLGGVFGQPPDDAQPIRLPK